MNVSTGTMRLVPVGAGAYAATEFDGGRYGALRTGEAEIDIPHGEERDEGGSHTGDLTVTTAAPDDHRRPWPADEEGFGHGVQRRAGAGDSRRAR